MRRDEKKFLNTYKPSLRNNLKRTQPGNKYINREDIKDEWIEKTAARLALDTKPTKEQKRAIYAQGGVIYFDHIMQRHYTIT